VTDPDDTTATRHRRGEEILAELGAGERPGSLDVRTCQLALVAAFAALGRDEFVRIHGGYTL